MAALVGTVVASGFVIYAVSLGVLAGVDRDESLKETETLSTVAASTIRAVLREPVPMLESVARALGATPRRLRPSWDRRWTAQPTWNRCGT